MLLGGLLLHHVYHYLYLILLAVELAVLVIPFEIWSLAFQQNVHSCTTALETRNQDRLNIPISQMNCCMHMYVNAC